jgi:hypothetical protein
VLEKAGVGFYKIEQLPIDGNGIGIVTRGDFF